jgi:hypothetical protein
LELSIPADCLPDTNGGWTDDLSPQKNTQTVEYTDQAVIFLQQYSRDEIELWGLINEVLSLDPRPAYYREEKNSDKKTAFSTLIYDFDLHFEVNKNNILVTQIEAKY